MEGQVGQIGQLGHAQVGKGLRLSVNNLVDVLTLDLVSGHGVPPEILVEVEGKGLEESLGNVDAGALLDDLSVDKRGDLRTRVLLGAVELEGLTDGALVVQHALQSASDIGSLAIVSGGSSGRMRGTYVNRPEALLEVVGVKQGAGSSELVKEVVLETEHRGGTHDGGLGVDGTNDFLTPGLFRVSILAYRMGRLSDLGREVLGGRVAAGVVGRDVDEAVHIVLGNGLGDALSTINVDVSQGEVPVAC